MKNVATKFYKEIITVCLLITLLSLESKIFPASERKSYMSSIYPSADSMEIRSSVEYIYYYDRGNPVLKLRDGRDLTLKMYGIGGKYLQVGDSITKEYNSLTVAVYRTVDNFQEVSVFGTDGGDGSKNLLFKYSGLLKRYRVRTEPSSKPVSASDSSSRLKQRL